ncbi:YciI family protein [Sphaerisporangium corydalis]|uniref:YciI family protein n=1 Tax=Sphaerisporangium corydalis TaxID=1441875 RepID=A0ABV9ELC1_9ACTN|nr:YciI family protein [Sphaerisporangium corydalis]
MDFVLLIHGDETLWDAFTEAERDKMAEAHRQFGRSMVESGVIVKYGCGLTRSHAAKLVRPDGPAVAGPYAVGREQIGGIWVIEVQSADEAESWARKMPYAPGDIVEVRPCDPA